jgi:GT2 family glycosyltransferase
MPNKITASIVSYNNSILDLQRAFESCLATTSIEVYIVDNSPINELSITIKNRHVFYLHNPSNPGFGAAHNIAIQKAIAAGSKYHFIINPDIHFDTDVITPMVNYMEQNPDVGMMMPEILNEDGSIQYLPKLLPNPFWIFRRKFKKPAQAYQNFLDKYELRNVPKDKIYNAPILSGCFTLLNLEAIKQIGMYDDKFFMYFEDFDLSRRMHQKYKTVYFPEVSVYHGYEGGANKSFKLFKIFLESMFTYFNKWGWFFDTERKQMNKKTLDQFKS